jgi:DNA-binding transcriptional regulator YdaS (Cro superfamily)
MSEKHRGVPERVLRAGAAATASPGLLTAVRAADSASMPDPARGQLWRASWDDAAQLVLVLRATATGTAVVVPVTVDPPASDESSVVVDAALTVLGHEATFWGGLAKDVPFLVFDLLIGIVAPMIVGAAEHIAANGGQEMLPEGLSAGTRVESLFDSAAGIRAEIADTLERFRQAAWVTQELPAGKSLPELLKGRDDVPALMRQIADALGLKAPEVISIMKGTRPVTPEHAPIIARITSLTEQQVLSAALPLPDGLIRELDRPKWRKALKAQRPPSGSETAARLKVAYGTLALAARQTGTASADSWPQRIRQYLATHPPDRGGQ